MPKKAKLSRVRPQRISSLIETQIKQAIFDNQFKVGEKLPPERELVEIFCASRSSIREALRSLEKTGFLNIKTGAHGGAFVTKSTTASLAETFRDHLNLGNITLNEIRQVRLIIEPYTASEAARKAKEEDIERLEQIHMMHQRQLAWETNDLEHNPTLHIGIAEITGNTVLLMLTKVLMDIHAFKLQNLKLNDAIRKKLMEQHNDIFEAIKTRNPQLAYDNMRNHILDIQDALSELEKS